MDLEYQIGMRNTELKLIMGQEEDMLYLLKQTAKCVGKKSNKLRQAVDQMNESKFKTKVIKLLSKLKLKYWCL